uniref:Putative group i salivary lipocalin n=1 Tax=Rhipicephalus pulchellus TaxID=72859 RepID=L7LQ29_RHIPC
MAGILNSEESEVRQVTTTAPKYELPKIENLTVAENEATDVKHPTPLKNETEVKIPTPLRKEIVKVKIPVEIKKELEKVVIQTPDIRKFVGLREPIWTYYATGTTRVECKVDLRESMTNKSIEFRREYIYKDQTFSDDIEGRFVRGDPDKMYIQKEQAPFQQLEQLIYIAKRSKCAIIMITLISSLLPIPPVRWYEVRVRDSAIHRGPGKKCMREFNMLNLEGHLIYTDDCPARLGFIRSRHRKSY